MSNNNRAVAEATANRIVDDKPVLNVKLAISTEIYKFLERVSELESALIRERKSHTSSLGLIESLTMLVTDNKGGEVDLYKEIKRLKDLAETSKRYEPAYRITQLLPFPSCGWIYASSAMRYEIPNGCKLHDVVVRRKTENEITELKLLVAKEFNVQAILDGWNHPDSDCRYALGIKSTVIGSYLDKSWNLRTL